MKMPCSQAGLVYYYAAAYASLGTRLPGAHGSIPTSAVYFNRTTGKKTLVAWNPTAAPITVNFRENETDLGSLNVPAGDMVTR